MILQRCGESLDLTDTERRLLGYLAAHRHRVVSKTQILTADWGYDGFDENLVEVHVSLLRRKLEAGGSLATCAHRTGQRLPARNDNVIQDERPAGAASSPLNTVSLRLRVTAAVMIVLAVMLILLSIAVTAIFIAQSNRSLNALLAGQAQLARQLAGRGRDHSRP